MAQSGGITRGIKGPVPGLVISSKNLDLIPAEPSPKPIVVNPSYAPSGANLARVRARAKSFDLRLGGVLNDVVVSGALLLDGSGSKAYAFDTEPTDGVIDSFYLGSYTLNIPKLTALGLLAKDVKLTLNELSNHPDLLQVVGSSPNQWLGSVALSGSNLSIPSTSRLTISPRPDGPDAFRASYSLVNGDLELDLAGATYSSRRLTATLKDARLRLSNSTQDLTIKGATALSMPAFGIRDVKGDIELKLINGTMKSLRGSIASVQPISALGLSGQLDISYSFKKKAGTLALADGSIGGVKLSGALNYSFSGGSENDQVTGQLTVDNAKRRGNLDIMGDLISLRPLRGSIDYLYRPADAASPGGHLKFTGVEADLIIGTQELPFAGSLDLHLHPTRQPTLTAMGLELSRDVEFNLEGVGRVKLERATDEPGVRFALAPIDGAEGLWPTFSGKISVDTSFGSAFVKINSLTSIIDDEIGVPFWRIDGAIGITG